MILPARFRAIGLHARSSRALVLCAALPFVVGCFYERAFPLRPTDFVRVEHQDCSTVPTVRAWLRDAHAQLAPLLPPDRAPALVTGALLDSRGGAIDVYDHFRRPARHLTHLFSNFRGYLHSAQASGAQEAIDTPAPPWPGFEDVWIPIHDELKLSGRLGLARSGGEPIVSDCIVILSGLLGDNAVQRTRDLGAALRAQGLHVLALEPRGFGQTEARFPGIPYNFGVLETGDLLAVARWLQARPYVRDTGLIGFCWGANQALLAAWADGRTRDDPDVADRLRERLSEPFPAHHFRAGVIAFSPVLDFEDLCDQLETPRSFWMRPALNRIQEGVKVRMRRKAYPQLSGSLRALIRYEFARSELDYAGAVDDAYDYVRFLPYKDHAVGNKLERIRTPALIVHAANDPLATPQMIANLIAGVDNPNVAALMLAGGGHVGFAPYAQSYFYSLILNFFDPVHGAAAALHSTERKGFRFGVAFGTSALLPFATVRDSFVTPITRVAICWRAETKRSACFCAATGVVARR